MKTTTIGVLIDTREKTPLIFPSSFESRAGRGFPTKRIWVQTFRQKLDTGDYAIAGREHICLLERKKGARELVGNLCARDYIRQIKALKRLAVACYHPLMLIESNPVAFHKEACTAVGTFKGNPFVLDYLWRITYDLGIEIMWGGIHRAPSTRRILGELVLRWMLSKKPRKPVDNSKPVV